MEPKEIRTEIPPADTDVATSAQDLGRLFVKFLAAGDLDGLVSLYEPEATFHPEPGRLVSGSDAIRDSLGKYIELGARVFLELRTIHVAGDLALQSSHAKAEGLMPNGEVMSIRTTEVARRQPDGRWLYVIDDPFFETAE